MSAPIGILDSARNAVNRHRADPAQMLKEFIDDLARCYDLGDDGRELQRSAAELVERSVVGAEPSDLGWNGGDGINAGGSR